MGKAARNRARRKNQTAQEQQGEAACNAVGEILWLEDLAAFTDMLERRPDLLGEPAIDELRRVAQSPGYGPLIARALQFLEGARNDRHAAWEAFARAREFTDAAGRDLEALQSEIDAAQAAGELPHTLELIEHVRRRSRALATCTAGPRTPWHGPAT
jgi:hypothetical protein